jgi:hypothetical protein
MMIVLGAVGNLFFIAPNVKVLCARFNGAKHVLPAGAVYLAGF